MMAMAKVAALCCRELPAITGEALTLVDQRRPDRRVYRIGHAIYAKAFTAEALPAFHRELAGLEFAQAAGIGGPRIALAEECGADGALLVTAAAPGKPLGQVIPNLDAASACVVLEAVGGWIGRCHAAPEGISRRLAPTTHESERSAAIRAAKTAIACLGDAACLSEADADLLHNFVKATEAQCFASPVIPGHGDLNCDHLFVSVGDSGDWACTAIDFECAGRLRQELDLVYPLLYVLGTCLEHTGSRSAGEPFAEHAAVRSFARGYQRYCAMPIPWQVVACHAVCWSLEVAHACLSNSSRQGPAGARPATRTAVQWASRRFT